MEVGVFNTEHSRGCRFILEASAAMPDYYMTDETLLPYSALFWGGEPSWSFWQRTRLLARKTIGWRIPAKDGHTNPAHWPTLNVEELPPSLRDEFRERGREMERLGFAQFATTRSNGLGYAVTYRCTFISHDRTCIGRIVAYRYGDGRHSASVWGAGFHTDLTDGTILLTLSGPRIPDYFTPPNHRTEGMLETTPIAVTYARHQARVAALAPSQVVPAPSEGIAEYLLRRAESQFQDRIATGAIRKLTDREVAKLRDVAFDFD